MRELALFAGAGGGLLASELLGWRTVCAVEIDRYARSVLLARQNDGIFRPFPIWDDVQTFDGKSWRGLVDVVSGGFPCQAFSTAAAGRNVAPNLWPEMQRIIKDVKPKFVFCENVSAAAIDCAAESLESMGFKTKAIALSAVDLGGDHFRQRYWLFAHAYNKVQLLHANNAEMAVLPNLQNGIWRSYDSGSRMADGVAHRVDRLRAIGNGQVPAVAAGAWRILSGMNFDAVTR